MTRLNSDPDTTRMATAVCPSGWYLSTPIAWGNPVRVAALTAEKSARTAPISPPLTIAPGARSNA